MVCIAAPEPVAQACLQGRRFHGILVALVQGPPSGAVQEMALALLLRLLLAPPLSSAGFIGALLPLPRYLYWLI
jgi:hypothetical protein